MSMRDVSASWAREAILQGVRHAACLMPPAQHDPALVATLLEAPQLSSEIVIDPTYQGVETLRSRM